MIMKLAAHTVGYQPYSTPITAIIVDDHPLAADGLKSYLETDVNITVAAICHTAADALDAIDEIQPDIVLLDVILDGSRINGIELAKYLRKDYPSSHLKILIVSAYPHPQYVFGAIDAQVNGYIIKTSSAFEIIDSVYATLRGASIWDPQVQTVLKSYYIGSRDEYSSQHPQDILAAYHRLTLREKEICHFICNNSDCENKEIARELCISVGTVKTHKTNIFRKLNLKDWKELRVWYLSNQDMFDA